ncbi:MAG TPA: amino acid deaminase [Terriglobales bacterium]|nr:amino acid deaminase [Terriglobales bacterium]
MNNINNQSKNTIEISRTAEPISALNKGLGTIDRELSSTEIPALGWHLLREDLSLPTAVLYEDKLAHNLRWMQEFVTVYGMKLAPHGKTTMAPTLFTRQLEAGSWGITLATAHQTQVAYEHGVRRVLMANQLVGKQNMAIIARLLEDPEFEYFCLVDSAEQVESLGQFFRDRGKKLQVLIEVGVDGGRTGVRDQQQLYTLLASLTHWREHLRLCGVEVFEGVLKDELSIRQLLQRTIEVARELAQGDYFDRTPIILSGAGSAWYDVVAETFSKTEIGKPVEVILRPGCYLTHDVGAYRTAQHRIQNHNPIAQRMHSSLLPALQLWAYVHSVPEKNKAILGLGKRDAAFDAGLPVPALHYRPGSPSPVATPIEWQLTSMMDQHAFLQITEGDDIRVGDMIGFDISHPCLTFDKWRYLSILDSEYRVIDVVQTFF